MNNEELRDIFEAPTPMQDGENFAADATTTNMAPKGYIEGNICALLNARQHERQAAHSHVKANYTWWDFLHVGT